MAQDSENTILIYRPPRQRQFEQRLGTPQRQFPSQGEIDVSFSGSLVPAPHQLRLQGEKGEIVRFNFPIFRVNRIESPIQPYDGDYAESLTLYDFDWPDDSKIIKLIKIIKTFCGTFSKPMEKHDFISSSNNLFVRFESKTGSYSGSSLYYKAHYDFFNATRFGKPVLKTECDEVFSP